MEQDTRHWKLMRRKALCQKFDFSESTSHRAQKAGLIPPPLDYLDGCTAWPQHELDAIVKAIVRGSTQDEIKALVIRLVAERKAVA